ncbi:MAG TPA: YcnI family protein [Acidimicrobiia bacterium]|nr:YcnI family protein [Acidimicrobiia bacterium]
MKRTLFVTIAAAAALVLPATGALAHVTVNPRSATQGGYTKLAFRVPNERDGVDSTGVEVNFPADHPITSVSVRPHPGWIYSVETAKLAKPITSDDGDITRAVTKITWTGGTIKPGEFDEFEVSVGPLPTDTDSLTFKALQTYSDGQVVRWIEEATPGGAEPDHPAPVLTLTRADAAPTTPTTAPAAQQQGGEVAARDSGVKQSDVDRANWFGLLGLAFGALGFATALASRRRRPSAG